MTTISAYGRVATIPSRRLAVAVVVVAAMAGVAVVQVADPLDGGSTGRGVDLTDPPAAVAATAMAETETRNYVVSFATRDWTGEAGETAGFEPAGRLRVDNARDRVLADEGGTERVTFTNAYFTWTKRPDGDGRRVPVGREHPPEPFRHERRVAGRPGAVEVRRETPRTLVLGVTNDSLVATLGRAMGPRTGPDVDHDLTLYVDKQSGHLDRAVFHLSSPAPDGTDGRRHRVVRYEFGGWGETAVERPSWAGYSLEELAYDILDERPLDRYWRR